MNVVLFRKHAVERFASMLLLLAAASPVIAQVTPLAHDRGAIGLGLALRRLPQDARVLYVTAHPDDERNGVLVKLSRGLGLETALLTVTRGDGGQNEIGPELFQAIGILRTEELAAVHRYDGVQQFFTSAFEFGYSFSVEETFAKWGREAILRDVVRVVRSFRPDVILTMPREASGGGQHHQASAQLAQEAFRAAADPAVFPDQLEAGLRPWQARKIYETSGGFFGDPSAEDIVVDTSPHDALLGMSWHQFGMRARSSHRCQGMGQLEAWPGEGRESFVLVDSEPKAGGTERDIFDGLDLSIRRWSALVDRQPEAPPALADTLDRIERASRRASSAYDLNAPQETIPPLTEGLVAVRGLRREVQTSGLPGDARAELLERIDRKDRDFQRALTLAHGLELSLTADDGDVIHGQSLGVTAHVFNSGTRTVVGLDLTLRVPDGWSAVPESDAPETLAAGSGTTLAYTVSVGRDARYSQPYWHRDPALDRYAIDIPEHHTLPWSPPPVIAELSYTTEAGPVSLDAPAYYRYTGPWVGGEKQKVLNVVPALSVTVTPSVTVVPLGSATRPRQVRVNVTHNTPAAAQARVRLEAPEGWTVAPREIELSFVLEGEQAAALFSVSPPPDPEPGEVVLRAVAQLGDEEFHEGYQVIAYHHIQSRHLFHPAQVRLQILDVAIAPEIAIGYVSGSGDAVPAAIESLGAKLTLLSPEDIAFGDLSRYSTIVTGIRAYQTRFDLKAHHQKLLDYVQAGGHLVVQYNKFEFNQLAARPLPGRRGADTVSPFAPYPAAVTRDRISVEDAPVSLLAPGAVLLSKPNQITAADFEGWVQERGLYFLGAQDARYIELLSAEDPWPKNSGEKRGLLVTARVGRGTWTYVGLGLWRQLPAGTAGAYRLLANLLSQPTAR
jgi:LmbE family N-acetylglucosaminyl deacetylase